MAEEGSGEFRLLSTAANVALSLASQSSLKMIMKGSGHSSLNSPGEHFECLSPVVTSSSRRIPYCPTSFIHRSSKSGLKRGVRLFAWCRPCAVVIAQRTPITTFPMLLSCLGPVGNHGDYSVNRVRVVCRIIFASGRQVD